MGDSSYFAPTSDGQIDLGWSSYKWNNIYASTDTIYTSDRNEKNTINDIDPEMATSIIEALKPSTYKLNNGTSDRTHYGFIAQDVEDAVNSLGIETKDFAAICKWRKTKTVTVKEAVPHKSYDEDGNTVWEDVEEEVEKTIEIPEDEEGYGYNYGLRYDELLAPLVAYAQHLSARVSSLEEQLANALTRIEALENKEG